MRSDIEKDILNIEQASRILGISTTTLYKMVREKKIPHKRINTQIRFSRIELGKWLKDSEI